MNLGAARGIWTQRKAAQHRRFWPIMPVFCACCLFVVRHLNACSARPETVIPALRPQCVLTPRQFSARAAENAPKNHAGAETFAAMRRAEFTAGDFLRQRSMAGSSTLEQKTGRAAGQDHREKTQARWTGTPGPTEERDEDETDTSYASGQRQRWIGLGRVATPCLGPGWADQGWCVALPFGDDGDFGNHVERHDADADRTAKRKRRDLGAPTGGCRG